MEDLENIPLTDRLSGVMVTSETKTAVLAYKKKYNVSAGEVVRRALKEFFASRSVNFSDIKGEKIDEVTA